MSTVYLATTSDELRIKQAVFLCTFNHLTYLSVCGKTLENNSHVYCFVHSKADQLCLMYGSRIGDHLFPLSTYKKELSYLANLPQHLMEATILSAIKAIIDYGEEQIIKKFSVA